MTTAAPSTALATIQPAFTDPERLALAGFLAGYRGLTREAYTRGTPGPFPGRASPAAAAGLRDWNIMPVRRWLISAPARNQPPSAQERVTER